MARKQLGQKLALIEGGDQMEKRNQAVPNEDEIRRALASYTAHPISAEAMWGEDQRSAGGGRTEPAVA